MKPSLLTATRHLAMAGLLATLSITANGAALFTLEGDTTQARLESESQVRLSVLGWTEPEQAQAIIEQYQVYRDSLNHEDFAQFLQEQQTRGYLFTTAATGYSIKYAWQEPNSDVKRMVLLVTPALKSRNPYLWNTPNESPAPFSLMEIRFDGDTAVLKYAADENVAVSEQGNLELQNFEELETFATLKDSTPYYL